MPNKKTVLQIHLVSNLWYQEKMLFPDFPISNLSFCSRFREVLAYLTMCTINWEYAQKYRDRHVLENHDAEEIESAISGGSDFDDFTKAIKALTDVLGQIAMGESDDIVEMISNHTDDWPLLPTPACDRTPGTQCLLGIPVHGFHL